MYLVSLQHYVQHYVNNTLLPLSELVSTWPRIAFELFLWISLYPFDDLPAELFPLLPRPLLLLLLLTPEVATAAAVADGAAETDSSPVEVAVEFLLFGFNNLAALTDFDDFVLLPSSPSLRDAVLVGSFVGVSVASIAVAVVVVKVVAVTVAAPMVAAVEVVAIVVIADEEIVSSSGKEFFNVIHPMLSPAVTRCDSQFSLSYSHATVF
mmetsp:Transcript_21944/g.37655  ORF Transcript_21944/g.37655 Transcript_21944/m.37655 type:complete len:209 (+) Transcript_21944:189-815(+)